MDKNDIANKRIPHHKPLIFAKSKTYSEECESVN